MIKKSFLKDKYREARGGYSRLLAIFCEKCKKQICTYQKDGPGGLRRMYIDRIMEKKVPISGKNLNCPEGHLLGIKSTYETENRPCLRLFEESVIKKIVRLNK